MRWEKEKSRVRRTMHQRIRAPDLRQRCQRLQRHYDPDHPNRSYLGLTHACE